MSDTTDSVIVLNRALDQMGDLVAAVREDHLGNPTPCREWNVQQLITHVLAAPQRFLQMARGEEVDWESTPAPPETGWAEAFREHADDLIHHWHQQGEDAGSADWHTAEFAVHAFDLVPRDRPRDRQARPRAGRARPGLHAADADAREPRPGVRPRAARRPRAPTRYERLAAYAGREVG